MRTVRILWLDEGSTLMEALIAKSVGRETETRVELVKEEGWGNYLPFDHASAVLAGRIKCETAAQQFDVVVIGNNVGAGVSRAQAVDNSMRGRVIVVWNRYLKGHERVYATLGIQHFGSRGDIDVLIHQVLASL